MLDTKDIAVWKEKKLLEEWKGKKHFQSAGTARDQVIPLQLTLSPAFYELWQGIKAAHGLDNDFLNYMAGVMIKRSLITLMEMSGFGE